MEQPKKLAEELQDLVNVYLEQLERTGVVDEIQYSKVRELCDRVAKTDVCTADARRALVASLSGKTEHYEAALANLKATKNFEHAVLAEFSHHLNHGHSLLAYQMLEAVIEARHAPNTSRVLEALVAAGAYQAVHQLIATAAERQEVMAMDSLVVEVKQVVEVMNQLGIDDLHIARAQDIAGRILREEGRTWAGFRPNLAVLNDESGDSQILIQYFVGVSPDRAAAMNWELTSQLIENGLDARGININFLGINV